MKTIKALLSALLAVTMLVGCGSGTSDGKVYYWASELDIMSLDSTVADDGMSFNAMHAFTEGLTGLDENGETINALAEDWSVDGSGLVYTFKLRDAKWSNGTPVTANDFVYAWQRIIKNAGNYAYMFGSDGANIAGADALLNGETTDFNTLGVKAADDKTLVVTLATKCPFFTDLMSFPCFYPQNEAFINEVGEENYATSPETLISNGAFILTEWEIGKVAVYEKNPDYYNADAVKLDGLELLLVQDASTASMGFEQGDNYFCKIDSELVDKYKDSDEYASYNEGYLFYLSMNFKNEYIANKNIRYALAYAINRDDLATNILKDGSRAASGFVPSQLSKSPDGKDFRDLADVYTGYDLDKAQAYLDAGLKELGKDSIEINLLYGTDESPMDTMAEYLQAAFSKLNGLTITMTATTKQDRINNKMKNGKYDIACTRWGPDYADPTTYLNLLSSTNSNNYGGYENADYDKLLRQVLNESDLSARYQLMINAEKIIMEDYAYIPVFEKGSATLQSSKVTGLVNAAVGVPWTFTYVDIAE